MSGLSELSPFISMQSIRIYFVLFMKLLSVTHVNREGSGKTVQIGLDSVRLVYDYAVDINAID